MPLEKLPKELLLMVTAHLSLHDVEALALTMHRSITSTCIPLLKPLFVKRRHAQRVVSRFGELHFMSHSDAIDKHREIFGIPASAELINPKEIERRHCLDYLRLNGDLHWLRPIADLTNRIHKTSSAMSKEQMNELQEQAGRLNIKFPPGFAKLVTSKELLDRVPSCTACFFYVHGGLRRVPAAIDGGAGGYNISMYVDQQWCSVWNVYIEPGEEGTHCVLSTGPSPGWSHEAFPEMEWGQSDATQEEYEQAAKDGVEMAYMLKGDIFLEGFSFEEWLAMTYFEQWLWYVLRGYSKDSALEPLKEYVREVYVKK